MCSLKVYSVTTVHVICIHPGMNNKTITTASQLIYLQNTDATSSCHDTEVHYILHDHMQA